ncbi:MAG: hypothetical protein JWR67_82, partial [Mucilaginibacter sp.]|nr:hypothetical protein [Mucilaginibacter sp.]
MNNSPSHGLQTNEIERFQTTYNTLKGKFHIQLTGHINFHLEQFELFKSYLALNLQNSYVIKQANSDCYVLF